MLIAKHCACSSPFKGEVRWGMGLISMKFNPIPTPALPLKGREKHSGAQAHPTTDKQCKKATHV
jgi:hypothetical protein